MAAESSASSAGTSSRLNVVETTSSGRLEELVRDLDLARAAAEADERVDEPLQHVLRLDDLTWLTTFERVRLVVDDERPVALVPEHVEPAAQHDVVVLEREWALRSSAGQARHALR